MRMSRLDTYWRMGYHTDMKTQAKQNKLSKSIRIDSELWRVLEAKAKEEERPLIWFIEKALKQTYCQPQLDDTKPDLTAAD